MPFAKSIMSVAVLGLAKSMGSIPSPLHFLNPVALSTLTKFRVNKVELETSNNLNTIFLLNRYKVFPMVDHVPFD
jgi:hypothetical protein